MKIVKKWSIWKAGLDPVVGSEQGKTRPVLIISETEINKILRVVNVLPLTSRKTRRTIYPNETLIEAGRYGLEKESIVLCYQIRTLDKGRLLSEYGVMDDPDKQAEIIESLCFQLGIGRLGSSS
ncbi:MAG: type II toxin-antitoxin system PemK/MazF family toxin [Cytophagales bacterium]|nr:type II toxin-antitoxin system PemK/MazF family toxin [Cytophagales bacterium]